MVLPKPSPVAPNPAGLELVNMKDPDWTWATNSMLSAMRTAKHKSKIDNIRQLQRRQVEFTRTENINQNLIGDPICFFFYFIIFFLFFSPSFCFLYRIAEKETLWLIHFEGQGSWSSQVAPSGSERRLLIQIFPVKLSLRCVMFSPLRTRCIIWEGYGRGSAEIAPVPCHRYFRVDLMIISTNFLV